MPFVTAEYLRRQADACLRIARTGFDLATAERLRKLAAEWRAKAEELDELEKDQEEENFTAQVPSHLPDHHSSNGSNSNHG